MDALAVYDPTPRRVAGLLAVLAFASWRDVTLASDIEQLGWGLATQVANGGGRKEELSLALQKIDSQLWPEAALPNQAATAIAGPVEMPWRKDGRVRVIVKVNGEASVSAASLRSAELDIEIVNERFGLVQGWIAESGLPALADLEVVRSINPALPPEHGAGSVTSEGDAAARANLVRQLGYDGSGVIVGVISDGIDGLAISQASGDLPSVVVPSDPRCRLGSGSEGRAMLEIVHDLAPGATLLFSGTGGATSLGLVEAIGCLTASGVDVIVDDVVFFDQPFFEDGPIALTAASAVAAGVSYHTSAANYGDRQYLVDNYRPDSSGVHNFNPAGRALLNLVTVPPGGLLQCFLQWADPFGRSSNDYDLYLVEPVSGSTLTSSRNVQNGSQDPRESVAWANPLSSSVVVGVGIALYAGVPLALKLVCPSVPSLPLQFASSRFGISGQAARSEVIAVAAISAKDPGLDQIESFSSQGPAQLFFPTVVARPKPDLAAFDNVTTTVVPRFAPFLGTSAAAPHSAAIAALLLSKNADLSPAQVRSVLTSTAVDIETPGFDSVAGFGRIDALAAINAVPTTTAPTVPATTTTTVPACTAGGCDDTNVCTDDACDPVAGCQHLPNDASCSDGAECTVTDRCGGGQCQPGATVTAGTVSTLISARVNASLADCRSDKRKSVKKVVNPLVQAAKAFSRAEVAGAGTKKWTKKVSAGEKSIGNARSKLTRVQAKLSLPCVDDLTLM
jgi:hypothetical protein